MDVSSLNLPRECCWLCRHELKTDTRLHAHKLKFHTSKNEIFLKSFSLADQNYVFANSVDPDETAQNEPSHRDLYCLPFCF